MKRLNVSLWVVLGLVSGMVSACDVEDVANDPAKVELEQPSDDSDTLVTLRLESDFELEDEEAYAVRIVAGYRFEIGMRIEDYEALLEQGTVSIDVDLAAPSFSEVSHGGTVQRVEGSPLDAAPFGDQTVCGNALVRSYHLDHAQVGMIVDMSHVEDGVEIAWSTEDTPQTAVAGDVLYSTFNDCSRFVGWDGECGGTCGKYRLWIHELWGEYSYGHCVPAGDYWLSSCKCEGPYGPWVH